MYVKQFVHWLAHSIQLMGAFVLGPNPKFCSSPYVLYLESAFLPHCLLPLTTVLTLQRIEANICAYTCFFSSPNIPETVFIFYT